jgi:hypothetical protein
MTPTQAEELLRNLKDNALTLEELHERVRTSGSAWSMDQLGLFLLCAPGVQHDKAAGTFNVSQYGTDGDLQNAILEAVGSFAGKPVPAAQIRARLPNHFITTDEQIIAVARRAAGLEVFGPKLIRIAR